MFFELKPTKDSNFPCHHQLTNSLVLNTDHGWTDMNVDGVRCVYKGYNDTALTDQEFLSELVRNPVPKFTGNFLAFLVSGDSIIITHDIYRGTPIKQHRSEFLITNLPYDGLADVYADKILQIRDGQVTDVYFNPYQTVNNFQRLDDASVIAEIDDILNHTFETFLTKNTKPVKIFLSGGVDTLTCFSYLKKFTNNFEILAGERFDFTQFYCAKKSLIKDKLWGYRQLHHLREECVLVTGGCGDEYFLRSPVTVNMLLAAQGSSVLSELDKWADCYHAHYFLLDKHRRVFDQQQTDAKFLELVQDAGATRKQILNMLLHDHQHWHLENTLTFTPLKNLECTNLLLRASPELIVGQIMDSTVNRHLIHNNDPDLLQYLSVQKNVDTQENAWPLYQAYSEYIAR